MVARGAGAAGPVLLACRQWDPRGLARRLPSRGAGAWRGAPLLPLQVQCPGRVCAALAAGSGGSGRCLVSCPPRFPLPAPPVLRCVWRVVPSRFPLPSLAGTPFHAVCAFRGLGPVALLVFPACSLWVCPLVLPRRPRPPPLLGVAHAPRAVLVLGAGRAVPLGPCPSAHPAPVPFLLGGGGPVPFPPYLAWGCVLPVGWARASGAFLRRGVGWDGGGRPVCRSPSLCCRGGQWGWGSPFLGPSLCLPWAGNKAGVLDVALAMEGVAPIPLRFVFACCLGARSVWRPGVLARVRWSIVVPARAGGWGVGAGPALASLMADAVLLGGRGITSSTFGGVGAGAPVAYGLVGGGGETGGGSRRGPPPPYQGGGAAALCPAPLSSPAHPLPVGVVGQPRAPGAACRRRASLAGGGGAAAHGPPLRGGLPRGRGAGGSCCLCPSLCPPWAGNIAGVLGNAPVMGAQPPYCSVSLSCAAPGRGPCAVLVRWCGFDHLPGLPRGQAVGGAGACGVRVQLRPSPGVMVPSGGGGWPLRYGGGRGTSVARRPGGGGGERGGGATPPFPSPLPWGAARGPRPCPPSSPAHPPRVHTGRWAVGRR